MAVKTTVTLKVNIHLKLRQTLKPFDQIERLALDFDRPRFSGRHINDTIKGMIENIGKNNKNNDDHSMEIDTETRLIQTAKRKVTESEEEHSTYKKQAKSEGHETNENLKGENYTRSISIQ